MYQVKELLESRAVSKKQGKLSASRSFHVWDDNDATPLTSPAVLLTLFGTNGLPIYGQEFPDSPNLVARDYEFARVSGHSDLWLIRWDYSEFDILQGQLPPKEPGQPGYVEISATISAERVQAWRSLTYTELLTLTSSNAYPQGNGPTRPDIGGDKIDVAGQPLDAVVRQVEITITEVRSGIPDLLFLLPYTWTRNNNEFLNAPVGQLLYCGANINRIDVSLFQFSHKFVLDRWWHMRQACMTDPEGRAKTIPEGQPPVRKAQHVFFVQPFPDLRNFFQMSPNFRGTA